jgi:hypothetical protein
MTRRNIYPAAFIVGCCILFAACTQQRQPCLSPKTAGMIVRTMHKAKDTSRVFTDSTLTTATFIPQTDPAVTRFVYTKGSLFSLSLSPDSDMCRWAFTTDTANSVFVTFSFYYRRRLEFLSNACGYIYFYDLDSVRTTHAMVDSVHIINASVTNDVNTKHVEIYLHPGF